MKVYKSLDEININESTVVTIGNFDGVHIGHQTLIKYTIDRANSLGYKSVVFTFSNHPVNFFKPNSVKNIMSEEEKEDFINYLGADILVTIPFDEYMTKISAEEFLREDLIGKLNMKSIVVGHDFSFARNREGNARFLEDMIEKYGYELKVFNPIKGEGQRISSTLIREAIESGDMKKAKDYLGRFFLMKGKVYKSKQNGRKIGFPTANMEIDDGRVLPRGGIYASRVKVRDKYYYGATNVGYNPTVKGKGYSIETYIFDFDDNIYGEIITFEFIERIRDEVKFDSLEELGKQIEKDAEYIRENFICKTDVNMLK